MANNKRKGRTRIKLDARKIALAKQLILREATTTVIANELNISRTFAWRLRKSLVNGISLHERVIDPPEDEEEAIEGNEPQGESQMPDPGESLNLENHNEQRLKHQPIIEHIKRERATTEEEEEEEEDVEEQRMQISHNRVNNHESENESENHQQRYQLHPNHNQQHLEDDVQSHHIPQQPSHLSHKEGLSVATSVIQRTNELKLHNAQQQQQQQQQFLTAPTATATATSKSISTTNAILEQHKMHNKISVVQQQRLMEINNKNAHLENNNNDDNNHDTASNTDTDSDNDDNHTNHHSYRQQQQILEQQQRQLKHQETEIVNSHAQQQLHQQQQQQHHQQSLYLQQKSSTTTTFKDPQEDATPTIALSGNNKIPLISQLSPAVAAAM